MAYLADPGGVFASDAHRRVLGHLPVPSADAMVAEDLLDRMRPDAPTDFTDIDELIEVLEDLGGDGYVNQLKSGWKMTDRGFEALNGRPEDG